MKFVVDFMLGKLARTLRMLGFDTKYVKHWERKRLLYDCIKEKRILLTRNRNLPKSSNIFVVESEDLKTQLKELDAKFNLKSKSTPFTRCLICNTLLISVPKSKVKDKVPIYVYETHQAFGYCKTCDKFYWKGTHYQAMVDITKELFK